METDVPFPGHGVVGNIFIFEVSFPEKAYASMFTESPLKDFISRVFLYAVLNVAINSNNDMYREAIFLDFEDRLLYYKISDVSEYIDIDYVEDSIDVAFDFVNKWVSENIVSLTGNDFSAVSIEHVPLKGDPVSTYKILVVSDEYGGHILKKKDNA